MTHTVVYYKVGRDNTGIHEEIPVILTEFGPLQPLIHYILKHRHRLSESNTNKLVQAVGLMIDYLEANHHAFDNPNELFNTFVQRLDSGMQLMDVDNSWQMIIKGVILVLAVWVDVLSGSNRNA